MPMTVLNRAFSIINDRFGSKKSFLLSIRDFFLALAFKRHYFQTNIAVANRVIFVCQGNICRSALAEKVLKELLDRDVMSFGLDTHSGKPANNRMVLAAKSLGYDLTHHQSTSVDDVLIAKDDLLVCMEYEQAKYLVENGISNNVVVLGAFFSKLQARLPDPYSANDKYMLRCAKLIEASTKELASSLRNSSALL